MKTLADIITDNIIRLTEIEPFFEYKVKEFSSGNNIRLKNINNIYIPLFFKKKRKNLIFHNKKRLKCTYIKDNVINISSILENNNSNAIVYASFFLEVQKMYSKTPKSRIIKRDFYFDENTDYKREDDRLDNYLIKSDIAYQNKLLIGSIAYLRIILEKFIHSIAEIYKINLYKKNGKPRPFKDILKDINEKNNSIIPDEYKSYEIFKILSTIVHGNKNEEDISSQEYNILSRLVAHIKENINTKIAIKESLEKLGL